MGPLLFVIYIDDIDHCISSNIIKFADDIKLFNSMDRDTTSSNLCSADNINSLQIDLDNVSAWCSDWLLNLNVNKCFCLHFGSSNSLKDYTINNLKVCDTDCIADLGVTFTRDMKPSKQCLLAAAKAHKMISVIKLAFRFPDLHTYTTLYKALVRPHLEYSSPVWCPFLTKDIDLLEKVQRRFTRLFSALRDLSYNGRLSFLKLESLYARRLRFDLITVYKILHGLIDVKLTHFFSFCFDNRTRGHKFKLAASFSRIDVRKYFFSTRVIPSWNSLPASCAEAPTLAGFKCELSKHFLSIGVH